jgi:hypothetical protein
MNSIVSPPLPRSFQLRVSVTVGLTCCTLSRERPDHEPGLDSTAPSDVGRGRS